MTALENDNKRSDVDNPGWPMWKNIARHKATGIVSAFIGNRCAPAPIMCGGRM